MPLSGSQEQLYRDKLLNFPGRPAPYFFYDFTEDQGSSVPNLGSTPGATLNLGTAGAGWTSEGGTTFWRGGSDGAVTPALTQSLDGHGFTFFLRWRLDVPHNNYGVSFNLGAWDSFQYHQGASTNCYIGHDASSRFQNTGSGPAQEWMTVIFRSPSSNYGSTRLSKLTVYRNGSDPFPNSDVPTLWTNLEQTIAAPDIDASKFEIADTNGSNQFSIQHVGVWPWEMTDAEVDILLTKPGIPFAQSARWESVTVSDAANGMPTGGCYLDGTNFGVHPTDMDGKDRKLELQEWLESWGGSYSYNTPKQVNLPITVIIDDIEYPSTATRFTDITNGTGSYNPRVRILCDYISQGGAPQDQAGRILEIKEFNDFLNPQEYGFIDLPIELTGTLFLDRPPTYYNQSQIVIPDSDEKLLLLESVAEVTPPEGTITQQTSWNLFVDPGKTQEEDAAYLANLPVSFDANFVGTLTLDDYNMTLNDYKSEVLATSPNIYFQFGDGLQNLGSDVGDSLEILGDAAIVPAVDDEQWTFIDAMEDLQLRQNTWGYSDGSESVVLANERTFNSDRQPTNGGQNSGYEGRIDNFHRGDWFFAYRYGAVRNIVWPSAVTAQVGAYESTSWDSSADTYGNQHYARYPSIGSVRWSNASNYLASTTYVEEKRWTNFAELDSERKQRVTDFCNKHDSPVPTIVVTQEDLDSFTSYGSTPPNIKSFDTVYFLCKNTNSKFPQDYRLIALYRSGSVGLRDNKVLSMKGYATQTNAIATGLKLDRRSGGVDPAPTDAYTQIFTFRNSLNPVPTKTQSGSSPLSPTWRPMKHWFFDIANNGSDNNNLFRGLRSVRDIVNSNRAHEVHPRFSLFYNSNQFNTGLDHLFRYTLYDYYEDTNNYLSVRDAWSRFGEGLMMQGVLPTTTDEWITFGVIWEQSSPERPDRARYTMYVNGVRLPYAYGSTITASDYKTFREFVLSIDGFATTALWHEHEYASAMSWDRALTDTEMRRLTGAPKTYVVDPPVSIIPIALSSEINIDHVTDATSTLQNWFVVDYNDAYQDIANLSPDLYWNFSPQDVNQNVLTDASGNGRTGQYGRAFLDEYQGELWWRVPTTLVEKTRLYVDENPVLEPVVSLNSNSTSYFLPTIVELDDGTVVDMRISLRTYWYYLMGTTSYRDRQSTLYFQVEDTEEIFTISLGNNYVYNYAIYSYTTTNQWSGLWGSASENVQTKFAPYAGKRVKLMGMDDGTSLKQLSYREYFASKKSPTAQLTTGSFDDFTRENYKSFIGTTNPLIYWEFDTEGSTITNLGSAGSEGDATVTGGTWERNGWRRSPGDNVQSSYVWPTGGVEDPITIMFEYEIVPDGVTPSGIGPYLDFGTGGGYRYYYDANGGYMHFRGSNYSTSYYVYGQFSRGTSGSLRPYSEADKDAASQDTRRRRIIMRAQGVSTSSVGLGSSYMNAFYSSIVPGETSEEIPGETTSWSSGEIYETGGYGPNGIVNERIAIGLQDSINVDYVIRRVVIWDRKLNDQEADYLQGGPPGTLPASWRTVAYSEPSAGVSTSPPNVQAISLKGQNAAISGPWNEFLDVDHTFYIAFRNNGNTFLGSEVASVGTGPFDYQLTDSIIKFGFASNGWSRIPVDSAGNVVNPYYGSSDYRQDPSLPQVIPDHFSFYMYTPNETSGIRPAFVTCHSDYWHVTTGTDPEIDAAAPIQEMAEWNRLVIQTRHNAQGDFEWRWQMNARPFAHQQWSKWQVAGQNIWNNSYYRTQGHTKFGAQYNRPTHFYIEPPEVANFDQQTELAAVAVWRRNLTDAEVAELLFQNIGDSPLVGSVQMDIELLNADIIAIGGNEIVLQSTLTLDVVPTGTVTLPTGVAAEATVDWVDYVIPAVDPTVVQVLPLVSSIEFEHQLSAEPFLITIVQIDGSIEHDQVFEGSPWLVPILYKEAVSDAVNFTLGPSTLDLIGQVKVFGSSDLGDVTFEATPTLTEILFISTSADIVDLQIPAVVETRPHLPEDFLTYVLSISAAVDLPEPHLQATPSLTGIVPITSTLEIDISLGATPTLVNKVFLFNQIYVDVTLQATPTLTTILDLAGRSDAVDVVFVPSPWLVDILEISGSVRGDFYFLGSWTVPIVSEYLSAEVNADIELSASYVRWLVYSQVDLVDVELDSATMDVFVIPPLTNEDSRPPLAYPPGSEGSQGAFGRIPNVTSGARKATGGSHSELPPKYS